MPSNRGCVCLQLLRCEGIRLTCRSHAAARALALRLGAALESLELARAAHTPLGGALQRVQCAARRTHARQDRNA